MLELVRQILDLTKEPEPEISVSKKQDAVNITLTVSVKDYISDIDTLYRNIKGKLKKDNSYVRRKRKFPTRININKRVRKRRIGPS